MGTLKLFKPRLKKCPGKSSHKWLLYSSTLVLVSFLLAVEHISLVECGNAQPLTLSAIENETAMKVKVREKVGNSVHEPGVFGNAISNSGGSGNKGHNNVGNSVTSNELNAAYNFNAVDEDNESYDDEEEEDDDSYVYDSEEIGANAGEVGVIKDHEKDFGPMDKPMLGKCCNLGEGLNSAGACTRLGQNHLIDHDKFDRVWFPDKVYDDTKQAIVHTNISEWDIQVLHKIECEDGERTEVIFDMRKFIVLRDGSLFIHDNQRVIPALEFCMEKELGKGEGRVVKACFTKKELCDDRQCVRKCCPKGSISEHPKFRCDRSPLAEIYNFNNITRGVLLASQPACDNGFHLEEVTNYSITADGNLKTPDFTAPFLEYCLDYFYSKKINDHGYSGVPQLKALICFKSSKDKLKDDPGLIAVPHGVAVVFGIAMLISAICLAIAAMISWRLPELRSLYGKCQLSHLVTMFCLYLCLAIVQLGTNEIPQGLCTFFGVFIHICSLSSFLWLNLLCVNIYLTFRSLRPPLAARRDENRRLFFLCIYAWGIPAAFCIFLYILDATEGRLDPMPVPEYGKLKCLISNREAEFAYLFGPVGVLLLCNGLLFCLTAQELLCGLWRSDNSDSINFRRKSMGIVVAKLGIVMGMGWILDVLSWAVGNNSPYMFYPADLFNSFQGVLISIILLWRKRVLEVLHIRKPSIAKDETLTARPFLTPKNCSVNTVSNGDHDTSLVLVNEQ